MAAVTLRGISKRFGDITVVDTLDLGVRDGEFLTLLGPSGCGKTTTLRMIAGFERPSAGRVLIGGSDVTDLEPRRRQIGMVFQDYALFPHLTVAENVAFGLVERRVARDRIGPRVNELLGIVRLSEVGERLPAELSGGQQQRIALARAIASPPNVLLMDEPLGALDLKMREHMQLELRRIQRELRLTVIYVTHDQTEAMTMSDRIAVMNGGRIEQLDCPEVVYGKPITRFVANFVGKVNFVDGAVLSGGAGSDVVETRGGMRFRAPTAGAGAMRITLAIRPESIALRAVGALAEGRNAVDGRIAAETFCGNVRHYRVELASRETILVEVRSTEAGWHVGDSVQVSWRPDDAVTVSDLI